MLVIAGCDKMLLGKDESIISLEENLQPPAALNDGWDVSDMETQNINSDPIKGLITNLQNRPGNIHSLLIFRNNKLVSESYFDGWHRNRIHALRSASKSFISTLIGIAIDQGQISNVDQSVIDVFPEYADLNSGQKSEIKIKHILSMSAGLQWDETTYYGVDDNRNDEYAIARSDDPLRYLLKKDMGATPGSQFLYNSGLSILQSAIIKKATGIHIDVYAKTHLFDPLGITNYFLRTDKYGYADIAPLFLTPRDMGKLGQLFLDSGKWKGRQIVSAHWTAEASSAVMTNTTSFPGSRKNAEYGYNWWLEKFTLINDTIQTFAAEGSGGQYIFVVPALRAVVVFTGGNYDTNQYIPFALMENTILPSFK